MIFFEKPSKSTCGAEMTLTDCWMCAHTYSEHLRGHSLLVYIASIPLSITSGNFIAENTWYPLIQQGEMCIRTLKYKDATK